MNENKYLVFYGKDNLKELRRISDGIIMKNFPWLPHMHYDDFYSVAGEVLWNCAEQFDDSKGAQFETYLINCLVRKFKTRITYLNRKRRNNGNSECSLDALIEEGDICLMNMVASKDTVEVYTYGDKMKSYLKRLSKLQKEVLFAISEGYSNDEIKKGLNISSKELADACEALRAYRNISLLY